MMPLGTTWCLPEYVGYGTSENSPSRTFVNRVVSAPAGEARLQQFAGLLYLVVVAVLLLVHVGLLNPLPGVRSFRGILVKQPPHEVLPIVGAIAQALHTAPMIPKPHWLGMVQLLSPTPRHRRGERACCPPKR